MPTTSTPGYRLRAAGLVYDALNALLWLPAGSGALRSALVTALAPRPGERVIELGCGTGQVTQRLVATGAAVTAVDRSAPMLDRARRRAPGADLRQADVLAPLADPPFDVAVLAFVLHELPAALRADLLRHALAAVRRGGRLGILEWRLPQRPLRRRLWRGFVSALEPAPAVEVLDGAVDGELVAAGWRVTFRQPVAGGRAEVLLAEPA